MWRKACLAVAVCVALTVFTNSSAKALLVPGSYEIHLVGSLIDPSTGTFDVVGTAIQNFTMDLLSGGVAANPPQSTYSTNPGVGTNVFPGTMFSGTIDNDRFNQDTILFVNDGTWSCITLFCSSSGSISSKEQSGLYSISSTAVSEVPLPAALPLFMAALAMLGLFGWRRK